MIDTDKYEGHTEGPWEIIEWEVPNPQWDVMLSCPEVGKFASIQGCNKWRPTEVDVELIADAPLLLAEVKRLREKLFEAELWVNNESYTFENNIKELNDYAEAIE